MHGRRRTHNNLHPRRKRQTQREVNRGETDLDTNGQFRASRRPCGNPAHNPGDIGGVELVVEGDTTRLRMLSTDPPLVKPVSPRQIAQAAVYLASRDSKGITGMELFVAGGMAPL